MEIHHPQTPTFITKQGSSTVDLVISRNYNINMITAINTDELSILPAGHQLILSTASRKLTTTTNYIHSQPPSLSHS